MNTIIVCLTILLICVCICFTILYFKYLNVSYYSNTEEDLFYKLDKAKTALYDLEVELENCNNEEINYKLNKLNTILTY